MNISLSELRLKIDDLQKTISIKSNELKRGSVIKSVKELDGSVEKLSEDFDFNSGLIELSELKSELINLRRLLAQYNNSIKIDEHDTIQSALIKIEVKRDTLRIYEDILKNRENKYRCDSSGSKGTAYYDIVSLNFLKEDLTIKADELRNELNSLEVLIQNKNTSTIIKL